MKRQFLRFLKQPCFKSSNLRRDMTTTNTLLIPELLVSNCSQRHVSECDHIEYMFQYSIKLIDDSDLHQEQKEFEHVLRYVVKLN